MDPQQELFTAWKLALEQKDYTVLTGAFDPESATFPVIQMGQTQQVDKQTKGVVFGTVQQSVHIWLDAPEDRQKMSEMLQDLRRVCRSTAYTDHFAWQLREMPQTISVDQTTTKPLLHALVETTLSFQHTGGKNT